MLKIDNIKKIPYNKMLFKKYLPLTPFIEDPLKSK